MFSPPLRALLILAALILGGLSLSRGDTIGYLFVAAAALLGWGYFRHGSVFAAVAAFKRGDSRTAARLLDAVPNPKKLTQQDRAYYHWLRGMLHLRDGHAAPARAELERALAGRLRTEDDRSLAHCQLAVLAGHAGALEAAAEHLDRARQLRHRPAVAELIRQAQELLDRSRQPEGPNVPES